MELDSNDEPSLTRRARLKQSLSRVEKAYLAALRIAALIMATLLLIWIGWLLVSSAYKISRDADAVEMKPIKLSAAEVADIDIAQDSKTEANLDARDPAASAFKTFSDQYYNLYRTSFQKYRQKDDEQLTKAQFSEMFLRELEGSLEPEDLLGNAALISDEDYSTLLITMREAAKLPVTIQRLERYRDTPKVKVEDKVSRTRQEQYCSYFSDYFGECLSYDYRTVPYTQTVARMEAPKGVLTHNQLFAAYQDSFITKLAERRSQVSSEAASEREQRLQDNADGWLGLGNAVWFAGLFFALMFFFLLIAIERHQRVIASRLP